eukprot:1074001-Pyramimonas_sp.AAC.1
MRTAFSCWSFRTARSAAPFAACRAAFRSAADSLGRQLGVPSRAIASPSELEPTGLSQNGYGCAP